MADNTKKVPRGLSALLKATSNYERINDLSKKTQEEGKRRKIAIEKLVPNPFQPRVNFDTDALNELSLSIKQHGLIQPVIVRRSSDINFYEIIAGERRVRAAKQAGLTSIDVIVQNWDDKVTQQMTLLENIQREDLNHIEVAKSYQSLQKSLNLTQAQLADVVAKNRTTVTNFLRLLELPPETKKLVESNQMSGSFARTLLALKDDNLIKKWSAEPKIRKLSVKELNNKIQKFKAKDLQKVTNNEKDIHLIEAENKLSEYFDLNVKIGKTLNKGKVTIEYNSVEELLALIKKLDKNFDI